MQVILLERIEKLGAPGSEVSVKRGYARNWLLPQGKAILATVENRKRAKKEQTQIDARDQARKAEAEAMQQKLDGKEVVLVRAAGESGHLYGSVRPQDIAEAIEQQLQTIISKKFVTLEEPVRSTGIFSVPVRLHPEVPVAVSINVAPSEEEAKRQLLKREQARQNAEREANKAEYRKETKSAKTTKEEKAEEKIESTEEKAQETEAIQENNEEETKTKLADKQDEEPEKKAKDESEKESKEEPEKKSKEESEKKESKKSVRKSSKKSAKQED